jgi:hypothetical protein
MRLSRIGLGVAYAVATLRTLLQGELDDVRIGLIKSSFAVR